MPLRGLLIAAQASASAKPALTPQARRTVADLSVAVIAVLLLVVATTAILLIMRHRRLWLAGLRKRSPDKAKSRTRPIDPWSESAKRLAVEPHPEPGDDDDTIDLDMPPSPPH